MKKVLAFGFLAITISNAHADWAKIDSQQQDLAVYINKEAAEKSGSTTIKMWHILDYASALQYEGKSFRSVKANYEYECDKRLFRELIRILHKDPMGNGLTVYWTHGLWSLTHDPSTWIRPETGSAEAALVTAACTK